MYTIEQYSLFSQFIDVVKEASQADGEINISYETRQKNSVTIFENWQITLECSATPSAGSLDVYVKPWYATQYVKIGSILMTNTPQIYSFNALAVDLKLIPVGFDANKTFNAIVVNY